MSNPRVSVVVPARNEEAFLPACLDSLSAQTFSDLEVIVVDGDSEDRTASVVQEHAQRDPRIRLIPNPRRITPTSLNAGLRAARGELLVRVDGHATVDPRYVEHAVAHLDAGWSGAGGRVDAHGVTAAGRAVAAVMSSPYGIGNSIHHQGTTAQAADHVPFPAYPTALVRELGGWDEELPTNQDFELDHRLVTAGHRLVYDPEMVIDYHCQQTIRGVARQFRRYGRGKADVLRRHPGSLRARHLAAPALVAGLVGAAALAPFHPLVAAVPVVAYAGVLAAGTVRAARDVRDGAARALLPVVFAVVHLAWGVGFYEGAARQLLRARPAAPEPAVR